MRLKDLHTLPKVRDSFSYLYVERCKIEQEAKAIAIYDVNGKTDVPCANLTLLLLGPGSNVTHAAMMTLADNGCMVMWTGEKGVRFYAAGMGETRQARNLLQQSLLSSIPKFRLKVVRRMYEMRFGEELDPELSIQQIRGKEGVRVRTAYSQASAESGVKWSGRDYNRNSWNSSDTINRALSSANSCLYGVCQAAIISAGYSPGLGFIHIGNMRSFVFDIADLYKAELTIPMAFKTVAEGEEKIERRVRHACRDYFHEKQFLKRIIPDIQDALNIEINEEDRAEIEEYDDADPNGLWDPIEQTVSGGTNWGEKDGSEEKDEEVPF